MFIQKLLIKVATCRDWKEEWKETGSNSVVPKYIKKNLKLFN